MATTSAEQVCNLALLRVGERQVISSLDEASTPANVCRELYPHLRDEVLESFPWKFAEREATLALLADATASGWTYVYALPADCARAEYIYSGARTPAPAGRVPFKRLLANDVLDLPNIPALATDQPDAVLVYTSRVEKPALFSPLFVEALAWRLASDLALALAAKPNLALPMLQRYQVCLSAAGASQLNQAQDDVLPNSELISSRE